MQKLDPRIMFKIMDMIDERPLISILEKQEEEKGLEKRIEELVKDKIEFIVCDNLFEENKEILVKC